MELTNTDIVILILGVFFVSAIVVTHCVSVRAKIIREQQDHVYAIELEKKKSETEAAKPQNYLLRNNYIFLEREHDLSIVRAKKDKKVGESELPDHIQEKIKLLDSLDNRILEVYKEVEIV